MPKQIVGPRIEDSTRSYLGDHFRNVTAGAAFVLDAFPDLYLSTLADLKGIFDEDELAIIIRAIKGMTHVPQHAGRLLQGRVRSYLLREKTDPSEIEAKIEELSLFSCACLEIWAWAYETTQDDPEEEMLDDYTSTLA